MFIQNNFRTINFTAGGGGTNKRQLATKHIKFRPQKAVYKNYRLDNGISFRILQVEVGLTVQQNSEEKGQESSFLAINWPGNFRKELGQAEVATPFKHFIPDKEEAKTNASELQA